MSKDQVGESGREDGGWRRERRGGSASIDDAPFVEIASLERQARERTTYCYFTTINRGVQMYLVDSLSLAHVAIKRKSVGTLYSACPDSSP